MSGGVKTRNLSGTASASMRPSQSKTFETGFFIASQKTPIRKGDKTMAQTTVALSKLEEVAQRIR
ncbi:MAG: hypothetical protein II727_07415, partial [Oscillospiraceae bacterium]|nr:hypothetical protein [Oscillospiraceae bacterium]